MKKGFRKCLILRFPLSSLMTLLITAPVLSKAGPICAQTFIQTEIASEQITSAIQGLAKLKFNIDIARSQGSTTMATRTLEKKFNNSFESLTKEGHIDADQLKARLKNEILILQGLVVEQKSAEDLARKAEKDALAIYPIQLATKEQLQVQEEAAKEIRAHYKKSDIKVGFFANLRAKKWDSDSVDVISEPTSKREQITFLMQNRHPLGNWIRVEILDKFDRLIGEVLYDVQSDNGVHLAVQKALGEAWSNNNFFNVRKVNLSISWGGNNLKVTQGMINEALDVKRYMDVLEVPHVEVNVSKITPFEPNQKNTVRVPSAMSALRGDFPTKLNKFHKQSKTLGEFEDIIYYSNKIIENGLASHRTPRNEEAYIFFLAKYGMTLEYEQ